jgi:PAS domain S-box-containing protein
MNARRRVLIVDDDPQVRQAVTNILKDGGYIPIAAATGQEALKRIAEEAPDVALIDLKLEEMSGLALIREIKERSWSTECIVLTGYASQDSAIAAINLGAYGYVQKPYEPEQLMVIIRRAVEKQRAEEALQERTRELGERLRELNCLYRISNLVQKPGISLEEILQKSVALIPSAWRHSKIACARITLGNQAFRTKNFKETAWRQASDILVYGEQVGAVEVCYLEERPESDEGPFLNEERYLLNAIAERLGRIAERKRVEEALRSSQGETARSHRLLLALSQASAAVQRARVSEEVYCTVLDEVTRLGYHTMVFTLAEDRAHLTLSYVTTKSPLLQAAEKLAGRSAEDFDVAVEPGGFHDRIIFEGQPVFVESMLERLADDVPGLVRPLAEQVWNKLELEQGIYAPLTVSGEIEGILVVTGTDLTKGDMPTVTAFANQIAIALERARLYQETRESEERFRRISASAQDAIIMMDHEGNTSFWNKAAEDMFGYSSQEILGKQLHEIIAPQHYHEVYRQGFDGFKTTGKGAAVGKTTELTAMRQDGTEFPAELSLSAVKLKGRWNAIGIVRDISERKRAEEALRQYAAELEARNEELDAFAHTVAHDLKGPLGNVIGFADLLAGDLTGLIEGQLRECLQAIVESGEKMNNIIDALLLLASVRKMEDANVERLDMASIVTETQGRLAGLIAEHQAEILLPDAWPAALGYGPWVEEVWANYMSNAITYGGRPPQVELGAEAQTDGMVRFWVRDNGHGIPKEAQARLFTPFTRLDQVQLKGHGLGLSIARRIVEKLGGQVGVESEVGQGSVFSFTLPAASRPKS